MTHFRPVEKQALRVWDRDYSATGAATLASNSRSTVAMDFRPVSKPKNRKAQPHNNIQQVKYAKHGPIASIVALGVMTSEEPTITARPSGPMILPMPPNP
jgi:hypothetical protein